MFQLDKSMKRTRLVVGLVAATQLASCASFSQNSQTVAVAKDEAFELRDGLAAFKKSGAVTRIDMPKIGGEEFQVKRTEAKPAIFNKPFFYASAYTNPERVLNDIAARTGYKLNIQKMLPDVNALNAQGPSADVNLKYSFESNGTLSQLLDRVTSQMDAYWDFRNGAIEVFRTDTRTFSVYIPGGKKDLNANISLQSSGSNGGGGSGNVSVGSSSTVEPYAALLKTIESIVNEGRTAQIANSVVANESLGLISVTATPPQLSRIEALIDSINKRFAQNVLVGVKVYSLNIKNSGVVGGSLEAAYASMTKKLNLQLTPGQLLVPASGIPGQLVVSKDPTSQLGSSSTVVQALEEVGDVTILTSGQVMAVNGQPSPLQVANEFTFLASSTTTQAANVGTTTTLTPGTRTVGFTANFLPLILGDNRILLQYQISLSSLISLDSVSSGDSLIQTPNIATQSLQQQAFVKDGQSIVLFGFDQERAANTVRKGFTSLSKSTGKDRNVTVIVLEVYGGK